MMNHVEWGRCQHADCLRLSEMDPSLGAWWRSLGPQTIGHPNDMLPHGPCFDPKVWPGHQIQSDVGKSKRIRKHEFEWLDIPWHAVFDGQWTSERKIFWLASCSLQLPQPDADLGSSRWRTPSPWNQRWNIISYISQTSVKPPTDSTKVFIRLSLLHLLRYECDQLFTCTKCIQLTTLTTCFKSLEASKMIKNQQNAKISAAFFRVFDFAAPLGSPLGISEMLVDDVGGWARWGPTAQGWPRVRWSI